MVFVSPSGSQAENARIAEQEAEKSRAQAQAGTRYMAERDQIILTQKMDRAALRASWHTRSKHRRAAWEEFQHKVQQVRDHKQVFMIKALDEDKGHRQQPPSREDDRGR